MCEARVDKSVRQSELLDLRAKFAPYSPGLSILERVRAQGLKKEGGIYECQQEVQRKLNIRHM